MEDKFANYTISNLSEFRKSIEKMGEPVKNGTAEIPLGLTKGRKYLDKIKIEDMLHYQRRLLSVYFYELECCRVSSRKLRKMTKKDWTTSESYVLKILICMNKVVDEQIKKDISEIKHQRIPKVKGISEYLCRLSTELKDGKSWMQL